MKRSERVSTLTCEHEWVRSPIDPGTFRCSKCQAMGHKPNNQRSRPPMRKAGVHKELPYTVIPYGCHHKVRPPGGSGGKECGNPAYAPRGKCSIHSPLRVGEEDS
jgi:hypothetical protein